MFGRLREPGGSFTLIAGGLACLGLAVMAALLPVVGLVLSAALFLTALYLFWKSWKRSQEERYDLRKLLEPPLHPEEPLFDEVPKDEIGAPYCGWCDEAYAPGTRRCRRCGRDL